jgi:hypothetical protein
MSDFYKPMLVAINVEFKLSSTFKEVTHRWTYVEV